MTIRVQLIDKTGDARLCAALPAIAQALERQVNEDFAPVWDAAPVTVEVAEDPHAPDAVPLYFVGKLDDPEALAYHTTDAGFAVGYVGRDIILENGGTYTSGASSLSAAASHELLELLADAFCDFYALLTARLASLRIAKLGDEDALVALEVADPVQGDAYGDLAPGGVAVSNFVTPEWFRDGESFVVGFDHMGNLSFPGELSPGGYVAFSDNQQLFGERVPSWKRAELAKTSRRRRRMGPQVVAALASSPAVPAEPQTKSERRCSVPGCYGKPTGGGGKLCERHRTGNPI